MAHVFVQFAVQRKRGTGIKTPILALEMNVYVYTLDRTLSAQVRRRR